MPTVPALFPNNGSNILGNTQLNSALSQLLNAVNLHNHDVSGDATNGYGGAISQFGPGLSDAGGYYSLHGPGGASTDWYSGGWNTAAAIPADPALKALDPSTTTVTKSKGIAVEMMMQRGALNILAGRAATTDWGATPFPGTLSLAQINPGSAQAGSISLDSSHSVTAGQLISTAASGTAPLVVNSPSVVANLNAAMVADITGTGHPATQLYGAGNAGSLLNLNGNGLYDALAIGYDATEAQTFDTLSGTSTVVNTFNRLRFVLSQLSSAAGHSGTWTDQATGLVTSFTAGGSTLKGDLTLVTGGGLGTALSGQTLTLNNTGLTSLLTNGTTLTGGIQLLAGSGINFGLVGSQLTVSFSGSAPASGDSLTTSDLYGQFALTGVNLPSSAVGNTLATGIPVQSGIAYIPGITSSSRLTFTGPTSITNATGASHQLTASATNWIYWDGLGNAASNLWVYTSDQGSLAGKLKLGKVVCGTTTITSVTDLRPLNLRPPRATIINVLDFGAAGDGITDDTTAFNAAILAAYNQGGGAVYAPTKSTAYYIPGQLIIPNSNNQAGITENSSASAPTGVAIRLFSDAVPQWTGIPGSVPASATLDLRWNSYSNNGVLANAKIDCRGGALEVDHITLACTVADTVPLIQFTGAVPNLHDMAFSTPRHAGATQLSLVTYPGGQSMSMVFPTNDAIVLGGINGTANGGPQSAFTGYPAHLRNITCSGIRQALVGGGQANSNLVENILVNGYCGNQASLVTSAVTAGSTFASGSTTLNVTAGTGTNFQANVGVWIGSSFALCTGTAANSITVTGDFHTTTVGTAVVQAQGGAVFQFSGVANDNCVGNMIQGGQVEITNYNYGARISSGHYNKLIGVDWWDDSRATQLSSTYASGTSLSTAGYIPPGPCSVGIGTAATTGLVLSVSPTTTTTVAASSGCNAQGNAQLGTTVSVAPAANTVIRLVTANGEEIVTSSGASSNVGGVFVTPLASSLRFTHTPGDSALAGPFTNTLAAPLTFPSGVTQYAAGTAASSFVAALREDGSAFDNYVEGSGVCDTGLLIHDATGNQTRKSSQLATAGTQGSYLAKTLTAQGGITTSALTGNNTGTFALPITGSTSITGGASASSALQVNSTNPAGVAFIVQSALNQTANVFNFVDALNHTQLSFDANGRMLSTQSFNPASAQLCAASVGTTGQSDPLTAPACTTTAGSISDSGATTANPEWVYVAYTYMTATGETEASPPFKLLFTATGLGISFPALSSLPASVTSVKVYVTPVASGLRTGSNTSLQIAATLTVTSNATSSTTITSQPNGTTAVPTSNGTTTGATGNGSVSVSSANDVTGRITVRTPTGATFAAGDIMQVKFANAYASAPKVTLTPELANAVGLQPYLTVTTTGFTVTGTVAQASNKFYQWSYQIQA